MLSKAFVPGILVILASCKMPVSELRSSTPIDHTLLRGAGLHKQRNLAERHAIDIRTGFGNLARLENRRLSMQAMSVLQAPAMDKTRLKVVSILQQNDTMLVAYSSADASAHSAMSLIDISKPEAPRLRAELKLPTVDIESVAMHGHQVYFAGNSTDPGGPALGRISFDQHEWQDDLQIQGLSVKSVDAIVVLDERIVLLDRQGSQLVTLQKKDFTSKAQLSLPGLSQLAQDGQSVWALQRSPVQLVQLDADLQQKVKIPEVGAMDNRSFNGQLQVGQGTVLAVMGDGGVRAFCKADQQPLFSVPSVLRAGLSREQAETRSASLSHGLLLTASADAGLSLFQVSQDTGKGSACGGRRLRFEGFLDLGKEFRAELLSWQHHLLTVADGDGRLNLIYVDTDDKENEDLDYDS